MLSLASRTDIAGQLCQTMSLFLPGLESFSIQSPRKTLPIPQTWLLRIKVIYCPDQVQCTEVLVLQRLAVPRYARSPVPILQVPLKQPWLSRSHCTVSLTCPPRYVPAGEVYTSWPAQPQPRVASWHHGTLEDAPVLPARPWTRNASLY